MNLAEHFHMAFVGSGLSCSYTLLHYINRLQKSPGKNKTRLIIIEKSGEFWTGVPYGHRSGFNSLILTTLNDFIPADERELFIEWLKINIDWIFNDFKKRGGVLSAKWIIDNEKAVSNNLWDDVYIPRYIFGMFLKDRVVGLLDAAAEKGLLEYKLLKAEVIDIHKTENEYEITALTTPENQIVIFSKKIILSIGSPSLKPLINFTGQEDLSSVCIVEDMYQPGIKVNIERIHNCLNNSGNKYSRNLLIVGSNASALETLFTLVDCIELNNKIDKFYILSSSGAFPCRVNDHHDADSFIPPNLISLKNNSSVTSSQMLEAVKKDLEVANDEQIGLANTIDPISKTIVELLNTLSPPELDKFVTEYGVEIGKLQRRAGGEYLDVVESLMAEDRIEILKGKFIRGISVGDSGLQFEWFENKLGTKINFESPMRVLINCSGFRDLTDEVYSSSLIISLIKQNLCLINESKRGFRVNENFETSENFYLMGPLLAGNIIGKFKVWHAESCPRIFSLSRQLAEYLTKE